MPYERVAGSSAGKWTAVLGLCLAAIAAGSFIAFSLVARDATQAGLDIPVAAVAPASSAPAITFTEPTGDRASPDGRENDGVRRSSNGRDLVLGTRFFNRPARTTGGASGGSGCTSRCGGGNPGTDATPDVVPTRPPSSDGKGKGKGKPSGAGGDGNGGNPSSAGPSPNGKAKGHIKARGKGHDNHPGDH